MTPPPEGYRIVSNAEIPIVPRDAMYRSHERDDFQPSNNVGNPPNMHCQYAIPITEPEPQSELVATQRRVIEILEANLEKLEARFQAREAELMDVIESQRQRLTEIRICFNQINHNLS
jgi:hypothetical protein